MHDINNKGLFVEKYRPTDLDTYVGNPHIIEKARIWFGQEEIPHVLLYGPAGTGKTTLAKILANGVDSTIMYINASDENSVDVVRDKIKSFASTVSFTRWKVIILDEFDYMTPNSMAALRNLMETFSGTTRFVLTCNYIEKVIDPIKSRCQTFQVLPPSKSAVAKHVANILSIENITYEIKDLAKIVDTCYPDMRKILNTCQLQTINNNLVLDSQTIVESNYLIKVVDILKTEKDKKKVFVTIRQLLADSKIKSFNDLYSYLYEKVDEYATGHLAQVILIIAEHQTADSFSVDKEINAMAMLIKIINEI